MLSRLPRGLSQTASCWIRGQLLRCISTATAGAAQPAGTFTMQYLVNSLGLSPESALRVSKKLTFRAAEKPDAVLQLLEARGFTQAQVVKIIEKCPQLLQYNPDKILKPKFEFLDGIGVSGHDVVTMVAMTPRILELSKDLLTSSVGFLRTVFPDEQGVLRVVNLYPWLLSFNLSRHIVPNIEVLRTSGVPELNVSKLLMRRPRMLCTEPYRFAELVKSVEEMGFDPSTWTYILAITAMTVKGKWDHNMKVFKSLGLSDAQIMFAFKVQPLIFVLSEVKIRKMCGFIVGRMGFDTSVISRYPSLLLLSLENRLVPRYNVLEMLMNKGIVKKDWNLGTVMQKKEKDFLANFVARYQQEIPELLKLYKAKENR